MKKKKKAKKHHQKTKGKKKCPNKKKKTDIFKKSSPPKSEFSCFWVFSLLSLKFFLPLWFTFMWLTRFGATFWPRATKKYSPFRWNSYFTHLLPPTLPPEQADPLNPDKGAPDVVNFAVGKLSPSLSTSLAHLVTEDLDPLLESGTKDAEEEGFFFRETLAQYLSSEYGFYVSARELAITFGNSQAIDVVGRHLISTGDLVAVEDPSFFLASYFFGEDIEERRMGIPMNQDGLDVDFLEKEIEKGRIPKLVYTIPNYHNPTGVCLSEERKKRLVDLASKYDFHILSDDPYNLMTHLNPTSNPQAPSTLNRYDADRGKVITACSFSKILNADLRLGWVHAHPDLLDHFLYRSKGEINPKLSIALREFIETGGMYRHIRMVAAALASRCAVMCEGLKRSLPSGCHFRSPKGGYFVWVELPSHAKGAELLELSQNGYSATFLEGSKCSVANTGKSFENWIRLSFSYYNEEVIQMGVERICAAITHYLR